MCCHVAKALLPAELNKRMDARMLCVWCCTAPHYHHNNATIAGSNWAAYICRFGSDSSISVRVVNLKQIGANKSASETAKP